MAILLDIEQSLKILMGNEAIARGLLENGCGMATAYPGTPASEILSAFMHMTQTEGLSNHSQWSINEKVAFETALAHSYLGGRSAVSMKQVGLNVAMDPLMSSAYTGVRGGFIVISADDPGPHSSQTEQDSRWAAMMAKVPVLDPSSPREAKEMTGTAFRLSEEFEIPVMIRPTTRICHARQAVPCDPLRAWINPDPAKNFSLNFERNPQRWAATPRHRYTLHQELNEKLARIASKASYAPLPEFRGNKKRVCILASGAALSHAADCLVEMKADVDLIPVSMPFPLNTEAMARVLDSYDEVLVIEETYPVIEMQVASRRGVRGRRDGLIPDAGELTPDVVHQAVGRFLGMETARSFPAGAGGRRPTLCPGCPHRPVFYALRKTFPKAIYPSDIGCYTLGLNLGAVDTVLCMGAAVSLAAGFSLSFQMAGGEAPPVAATIGDSTFYHSGIPALVNAVHHQARFVLVVLDNGTTAMTGNQPTPGSALLPNGAPAVPVPLEDIIRGCGVRFIRVVDPYDFESLTNALKKAQEATEGGVAVVVARRPCIMDRGAGGVGRVFRMEVTENCTACGHCVERFECPAISMNAERTAVEIDPLLCTGCGVCVEVCPTGALVAHDY
ncbi:MAG: 4Fe-4S binding protein [Deltaproteobacteria bacterium]|nr:4Fe-4S binding protein [Deltaproteobacteria bacterium]MBW2308667.1 4Fe-4S binding protein [Deltaproteobacteria bacterium]